MNLQTIPSSASPEVPMNENFETLDYASVYGKRQPVTTALTWGYCGGRWGGFTVAAGTFTLTDDSDNYIVVEIATGTPTCSATDTNWLNTDDYARVYKITTVDGFVSAVEDHRAGPMGIGAGTPGPAGGALEDGDYGDVVVSGSGTAFALKAGVGKPPECIAVACSDETTALVAGTAKVTMRMPYAFTLTSVRASLSTAQASGSILTVDINEGGSTILSTKLTIDNTEKTSTTAAAAAVISDTSLADDAELTFDIDQVGDGTAKGLKVYLIGNRT